MGLIRYRVRMQYYKPLRIHVWMELITVHHQSTLVPLGDLHRRTQDRGWWGWWGWGWGDGFVLLALPDFFPSVMERGAGKGLSLK